MRVLGQATHSLKLILSGLTIQPLPTLASLSFFRVSHAALKTQLNLWRSELPHIVPYYAVKCNNDPVLMKWMRDLYPAMGFDCASEREINEVLPLVASPRQQIIYAQPCKKVEDMKVAQARGVELTVTDSVEEVAKLGRAGWRGEVLVRLLVRDAGSKQPFGKKFGAPLEWLPDMYKTAAVYGLKMRGFSFHVGSECMAPQQYASAIEDCGTASDVAATYGFPTEVIDIGGGFLPAAEPFKAVAAAIRDAGTALKCQPKRWIAEPGRFLAAPTHTLYTTVIGKKPVWPPAVAGAATQRVTIDESVYGAFSNIPFDHQTPHFERMRPAAAGEVPRPTVLFGRTCDSGDCLGEAVPLLEVEEGDVLRVADMGAYTTVTASEFNGFPKAPKFYELQ